MSKTGPTPDLSAVCAQFDLPGRYLDGKVHGSGHINDTYAVTLGNGGRNARYVLQRINTRVFKDVPALMENIARVCAHAGSRVAADGRPDAGRRALRLVPTRDGASYHCDAVGGHWRAYHFIEGATSFDKIESPAQARIAARAFGEFQRLLADLPPPRLRETIPHFHDTRRRFDALETSVRADPAGRAARAAGEIGFARRHEELVDTLLGLQARGEIPERITHNDTKLNNVMLDDATGQALCIIDLDTVMPGLALYDFGDMARSATNSAAEDEADLSLVRMRMPVFAALVEGYREGAGPLLNAAEVANLALAGRVITFEIGVRFLTDFLDGDVYFKTKRPEHNLDRARNQFALVASMEEQREAMEALCRG
jgi:aminoglycoside phosphotransferase (APT) family kinase protein